MISGIEELERKFIDLSDKINDPDIIADNAVWRKLMKEHSDLAPIIDKYGDYKTALNDIEETKLLLEENDEEMRALAKEELADAEKRAEECENDLKVLMLPKDPNDDKNVIMEIRGGAGGDEANIFAGDLFRM